MYPNPNFLTYFPDAELPADEGRMERSSCLHVGTFMVLEKLMMESMLLSTAKEVMKRYWLLSKGKRWINVPEYSRILIEQYCPDHSETKKTKFLWDMVKKQTVSP